MVPRLVKFIETKNRMLVARGWREGEVRSYCLMDRVLVWRDEVLEIDDDGCTTM